MEDDTSGAYFVCSEPSPRVFVIQRLTRQDAVRYCGDSRDEKQPKLHAPMPALPWWFTDDVQRQMREFDPSKHGTSLQEAEGAAAPSSSEQLRAQLRTQLEYYFSRENLITDRYLRCQMDADQYVPIKIIASFPKITQLTSDVDLIVQVLRESPSVQVDESGEKVRAASRRCTILIRELPESEEEEVKAMLEGTAPYQSLTYGFNNTWYVSFESEDATQRAFLHIQNLSKTFNDKPICARIKTGGCPNTVEASRPQSATERSSQKPSSASGSPPATTPDDSAPPVPTFDLGQILMNMGFVAKSVFKPGAPVVHLVANASSEAPPTTSPGVTVNVAMSPPQNGGRSPVRGHRSPRASPLFFGHQNFQQNGYLAASSNGYHNHYRGNAGYGNSKLAAPPYSGGRRSSNYEYGKFYKAKRSGPPANGPSSSNAYLSPTANGAPHRYRNGSYSNGRGARPRFPTSPSRMQGERYGRGALPSLMATASSRNAPRLEPATKKEPEPPTMDTVVEKPKRGAEKKKETLEVTPKRRTTSGCEAASEGTSKTESVYSFEEGEFPSLPEKERPEEKKEEKKPPPFSVVVAGRQKMEAKREAEAAAAASRLSYAQKVSKKAALLGPAVVPSHS
uniref:HTH La-type RNA-binding domain-containing protein n=1 Tax=Steinernema glaseri TaxID=37863 RepID=A0A1I7ZVL1_9BILA